jgi:hypothetical protein
VLRSLNARGILYGGPGPRRSRQHAAGGRRDGWSTSGRVARIVPVGRRMVKCQRQCRKNHDQ